MKFGFPFNVIRKEVLATGLADFSVGFKSKEYGNLTADDKVLLYCFVIMKRHLLACKSAYAAHKKKIASRLATEADAIVVDCGCGPGTALLGLIDLFPGMTFRYVGIDSAKAMRKKAHSLWNAACDQGLIADGSACEFFQSWDDVSLSHFGASTPVLFLCSYLFASHSLYEAAVESLANFVLRLVKKCKSAPPGFVYVNSAAQIANKKYPVFRRLLGLDPEGNPPIAKSIEIGDDGATEDFVHQMISFAEK